jgi:hypothetical protein
MERIEENKLGVLEYKIENHEYVIKLRWKDGKVNEHHFPEVGFIVVNPATGEKKGIIKGKDALKILEENSPSMTQEEFSWLDFVS